MSIIYDPLVETQPYKKRKPNEDYEAPANITVVVFQIHGYTFNRRVLEALQLFGLAPPEMYSPPCVFSIDS